MIGFLSFISLVASFPVSVSSRVSSFLFRDSRPRESDEDRETRSRARIARGDACACRECVRCYRVTHPGTLHPVRVRYKLESGTLRRATASPVFPDFSIARFSHCHSSFRRSAVRRTAGRSGNRAQNRGYLGGEMKRKKMKKKKKKKNSRRRDYENFGKIYKNFVARYNASLLARPRFASDCSGRREEWKLQGLVGCTAILTTLRWQLIADRNE